MSSEQRIFRDNRRSRTAEVNTIIKGISLLTGPSVNDCFRLDLPCWLVALSVDQVCEDLHKQCNKFGQRDSLYHDELR